MAVVLIPAYRPDEKMLVLIEGLLATQKLRAIVVVNDGSGADYDGVFERANALGAEIVNHAVNLGKGQALKTCLNHILLSHGSVPVIMADCDGQHDISDILNIAGILEQDPSAVLLGSRALNPSSPLKSRAGNAIMRVSFFLSTGVRIHDTQTGLRGFPGGYLKRLLEIPGSRYEYEMNMLLNFAKEGVPMREVPIRVIYIDHNAGSHFNPIRDALRVFSRLFAFAASSIFSYAIDYLLFMLLVGFGQLAPWAAYPIARLFSSTLNFFINRYYVFKENDQSFLRQIVKYYLLAAVVLGLGTAGVHFLTVHQVGVYISKPIVDTALYFVSFIGQRLVVFQPKVKTARQDKNGSF